MSALGALRALLRSAVRAFDGVAFEYRIYLTGHTRAADAAVSVAGGSAQALALGCLTPQAALNTLEEVLKEACPPKTRRCSTSV
jgi:hypothetical protein